MREFVVVGHEAPTTPEFPLDDLPGVGRMDLLARCVTASMLLSHGIRPAVRTHLVLGDEFTVSFDSRDLQGLNPDERSTAARIRAALAEREEAIGHQPVEVSPGVSLRRCGFAATLEARAGEGTVVALSPDGDPAREQTPPPSPVFVLSDHRSFTESDRATVGLYQSRRVSLGPEALHADHAIVVAHNWLDTAAGT
ncbi:MAG: tRNA (pseudouridine(54)-N(1))-methyltransferase TrmY [Halovenus sp.]